MEKYAGTWAAPQQVGEASALTGILNLLPEQVNLQSFEDALWNLIGDDEFYDKVDKLKKEAPTASKDILINYVKETLTKWLSNLVKENQWWKEKWDPKSIAMLKDFIMGEKIDFEKYESLNNTIMEKTARGPVTIDGVTYPDNDKYTEDGRPIHPKIICKNCGNTSRCKCSSHIHCYNPEVFIDECPSCKNLTNKKESSMQKQAITADCTVAWTNEYGNKGIIVQFEPGYQPKNKYQEYAGGSWYSIYGKNPSGHTIAAHIELYTQRDFSGKLLPREYPEQDYSLRANQANNNITMTDMSLDDAKAAAYKILDCFAADATFVQVELAGYPYASTKKEAAFIKVASLGEDLYKISDNDIPIDKPELEAIIKNSSLLFADEEKFWANLLKNKEAELKLTADTGTVVDMYEVDYPAGTSNDGIVQVMDPEKDLITETVMPGIPVKNVNINVGASKKSWREVLTSIISETEPYIDIAKNAQELYIEIATGKDNIEGQDAPADTVVKMRTAKDAGKWTYLFDCDSGEQDGLATDIPEAIKKVLLAFGHRERTKKDVKVE